MNLFFKQSFRHQNQWQKGIEIVEKVLILGLLNIHKVLIHHSKYFFHNNKSMVMFLFT